MVATFLPIGSFSPIMKYKKIGKFWSHFSEACQYANTTLRAAKEVKTLRLSKYYPNITIQYIG
jgi:hypothetical protein